VNLCLLSGHNSQIFKVKIYLQVRDCEWQNHFYEPVTVRIPLGPVYKGVEDVILSGCKYCYTLLLLFLQNPNADIKD
jgi:hypothetical protein